uniref:cellulase n=1 Tax=Saccoglossus kowalevskii TaxID=10224 RepID=A0ABM0MJ80_SACKO|nr:PREDICTED: endoglucanase 15-like [Saccoglossus kowalevskii]
MSYDYCEVLRDSLLFYEAQRSGVMTDETKSKLHWKKDSALNDQGENGEDLTGGYYDAGDHIKAGLPMAYTVTVVAWGLLEYPDAYEACGQTENVKDMIRWGTDYFLKIYPEKGVLYYQVGDVETDHSAWCRAQDMKMSRPALKANSDHPGCDVAAETAAALAAASIIFQEGSVSFYSCVSLD